jgi:hypothetical protein
VTIGDIPPHSQDLGTIRSRHVPVHPGDPSPRFVWRRTSHIVGDQRIGHAESAQLHRQAIELLGGEQLVQATAHQLRRSCVMSRRPGRVAVHDRSVLDPVARHPLRQSVQGLGQGLAVMAAHPDEMASIGPGSGRHGLSQIVICPPLLKRSSLDHSIIRALGSERP